jgi:hypothetical protein
MNANALMNFVMAVVIAGVGLYEIFASPVRPVFIVMGIVFLVVSLFYVLRGIQEL